MSKTTGFIGGDPVYGETAMEVVATDPEERYKKVEFWINIMDSQVEALYKNSATCTREDVERLMFETREALVHAKTALYAMDDMKNRPAAKWDGNSFWADFLELTL